MSDDEDTPMNEEQQEESEPEPEPDEEPEPEPEPEQEKPKPAPPPKAASPKRESLPPKELANMVAPREAKARDPQFSAGRPPKFDKDKLMQSEGIIRIQSGTNKHASQRGMTGFGVPRDIVDKVKSDNLAELTDPEKIKGTKEVLRLQSGSNKFASQKGQTGFGCPRDVLYKPKGSGGASEVEEEKARATDGIVPLQSGTNKLASQAGTTGFGMPRIVDVRNTIEQDLSSQGFIHLQMGTNRFATQAGMTGFGMPRHNISKYKDESRGEMPHDESSLSRQTSGYKEGASQAGMTGFSAFRNNTINTLKYQDRKSQGLIPYQMGINWADSQAGKTGFGMPRQVFTPFWDEGRVELPEELSRAPVVPFWSGQEQDFATQQGMTAMGAPRDVSGRYLRRLW